MHLTYRHCILITSISYILIATSLQLNAQDLSNKTDTVKSNPYSAEVGLMPVFTSSRTVPFWMRANQYGSIPLSGVSGSLVANAHRVYKNSHKLVDWGFGVDARLNAGSGSNAQLIEAYLKGRLSIFQLKVGRSKDIIGLVDSTLSVGAFSVSGNALGIPKIELSIPDYWNIPYTNGIVALKGSFTYGWFGSTNLYLPPGTKVNTYYHQASLYGRIGKSDGKVRFFGGLNHQAMWGGERIHAAPYELTDMQTFWYVVFGRVYDKGQSKIGNQLGSIDQALEVDLGHVTLRGYHQFIYDIGALAYLANAKDGLFGLSVYNKNPAKRQSIGWKKFVVEYFNTKSQAGEKNAKTTPSGDEDYYNNYIYPNGWVYKGENIGNPLLTQTKYARQDLVIRDAIMNNRVTAINVGGEGNVEEWNITAKFTYSRNFGTYGTSEIGRSQGGVYTISPPPYFTAVNQFSGYLEAGRPLKKNYYIGAALAADKGGLLYNSLGGFIKLSKKW